MVGLSPPRKTPGTGLGSGRKKSDSRPQHGTAIADRPGTCDDTWEVMDNPMRVNRALLYAGVFVVALGAGLLLAGRWQLTTNDLIGVLGLWPLALIAVGLGIALRRTQLGLASGLVAAAVPGLVLGGVMALSPRLAVEHGVWQEIRQEIRIAADWHRYCAAAGAHLDLGNVEFTPMGGCS